MSIEQVKEFHEAFGHPVADKPAVVDFSLFKLRSDLIREELEETIRDYFKEDLTKFTDGLADLRVVINGAILVLGGYDGVKKTGYWTGFDTEGFLWPEYEMVLRFGNKMYELLLEFWKGKSDENIFKCLNALTDMYQEVVDLGAYCGLPMEEIDGAVHKANMSKLGADGKPIYRESDNKILKGPNFRPPEEDIEAILKAHGAEL